MYGNQTAATSMVAVLHPLFNLRQLNIHTQTLMYVLKESSSDREPVKLTVIYFTKVFHYCTFCFLFLTF